MLSITKLEQLLGKHNYIPIAYFTIDKYCAYMEVVSIMTGTTFMLYIPSKYKFKIREGDNVYKLRHINIEDGGGDDHTEDANPDELQRSYTEVQLTNILERAGNDKGNIATYLEEGYKQAINVNDIANDDINILRGLVKQLKRLKYCVKSLTYRLVIIYKNYLCALDKDNSVICFYLKHYSTSSKKRLLVTTDLELYYENASRLNMDIADIERGIQSVFSRNQELHTVNMTAMMKKYSDVTLTNSTTAIAKRQEYCSLLDKFNHVLDVLSKVEQDIVEQLYNIRNTSFSSDTTQDQRKVYLTGELEKVTNLKRKTVTNITELKDTRDNLSLSLDNMFFDNLVMTDKIFKNLDIVKNL